MAKRRSLFKYYSDRKWGEAFLEGRFRFWSLAYFKDLEDAGGRGDAYEGTAIFQPEGGLQITNETQGTSFTMPGYAFASTVRYDEIFVFCMSRTLSSALWDEFGALMCVEISDIPAFCRRVASRLPESARFPGRAGRERIGRRVEYYDAADPPGARWALPDRIALSKLPEFAHQEEFRLVFSTTGALDFENVSPTLKPVGAPPAAPAADHSWCDVDVGDLRDICRVHTTRPRDDHWDTYSMIRNAKSLQRVVKELERHESESWTSDPLLFQGSGLAGAILLSLATEIALKAWQCRERKDAPDRTHDLLRLFEGLEPETQELLQAMMPGWPGILEVSPFNHGSLAELLWSHRDSYTHWRYLHEKHSGVFRSAELNQALTVILNAFGNRWGDSAAE